MYILKNSVTAVYYVLAIPFALIILLAYASVNIANMISDWTVVD